MQALFVTQHSKNLQIVYVELLPRSWPFPQSVFLFPPLKQFLEIHLVLHLDSPKKNIHNDIFIMDIINE